MAGNKYCVSVWVETEEDFNKLRPYMHELPENAKEKFLGGNWIRIYVGNTPFPLLGYAELVNMLDSGLILGIMKEEKGEWEKL